MGTVIGGLLLPQFKPYDLGGTLEQANRIAGGQTTNQTALLTLADLKAKQQAEHEFLLAIKQNPALAQQLLGGGSVLGSLGPGGGMPQAAGAPPGASTQRPMGGGGAAQQIPASPDLSQFATQGAPSPGTPTLATLGPQGATGGQPQPAQNPLVAMAAQNPRAAMMLQGQMQAQQDRQLKLQEQRLKMGSTMMESLGQMAQGVTDQAGWDQLRQDAAQISPQLAARVEPVYSKEGKARLIAQATGVKDSLTLQVQDLAAQAAVIKARKEGRATDVDNQLRAMGVQPGAETPAQMKAALQTIQQGKEDVSASQGVRAAEIERTEKPLEGAAAKSVSDLTLLRTMTDDIAALRHDDFTGPVVGRTGFVREQAGQMKQEEVAFRRTVKDVQDILGRLRSGAAIPAPEMSRLEGLAPSVNDLPEVFTSKLQSFQRALEQNRESITRVGTTGRQQFREETRPTTPRVGEQPKAAPTGNTFTDADIAATLANPANKGKTRQHVIDAALAKGLTYTKER